MLLKLLLKSLPFGQIMYFILVFNEPFNLGLSTLSIFFIFPNQLSFAEHHLFSVTTVSTDHHCQTLWSITSRSSAMPAMGNSKGQTEPQSLGTRGLNTERKCPIHKKRNNPQCRIYHSAKWVTYSTNVPCKSKVDPGCPLSWQCFAFWFSPLAIPSCAFYSNYSSSCL